MGLAPTRGPIVRELSGFADAPEFGVSLQKIVVEQWWWDHPTLAMSHLLKQIRHVHNQLGQEIKREIDEWTYDGYTDENQQWTLHRQELWAWGWLPRVNHRSAPLVKVEERFTRKFLGTAWVAGPIRTIEHVYGYAVYDELPSEYTPAEVEPKLTSQGRKTPEANSNKTIDSARHWSQAIKDSAIVEEEDVNQTSVWQLLEIRREEVEEDFLRVIRWTVHVDCLTGLTETEGPTEESKDVHLELPIQLEAPELKVSAAGDLGVALEIKGGGAEVTTYWPVPSTEYLHPEKYIVFRKTTTRPARSGTGDRYGLHETPPAEERVVSKLTDTQVRDYAGGAADPLPPQEAYSESEDASIPPREYWEQILELDNRAQSESERPWSAGFDELVENGASYEYYCVSRLGESESPESNHEAIGFSGGASWASKIRVRVSEKPGELRVAENAMGLDIEVLAPDDPAAYDLGLEDYGEQKVLEIPAAVVPVAAMGLVDLSGGDPEAWPAEILSAEDLGRAVGLRQFDKDRDRDTIELTPTLPLLSLERGQLLTIPALAWETYGRGLRLSTEVVEALWRVEGFGWTVAVGEDGAQTVTVAPVTCVEVAR